MCGCEGRRAGWHRCTLTLQQDSGAQASMMAVDNANGEVLAMVGGRDFALSQFNRATQAQRQVGSSFKPYVYTTAVEGGAKPTDIIVDGPTSFSTPNGPYTPHNYEGDYKGAMTLLNAFAESRNIPALKLARQVGIEKVIETAHRFGVTSNIPAFLPVAIGAADITLAEQVGAYSVFPNDGIRIEPHYIRKVTQADGLPLRADVAGGEGGDLGRDGADDDEAAAGGGAVWDGRGGGAAEASAGRQDGNDERLHGCVVHRVFAFGDVRDVDRVRRPAVAGGEGDGREGGAADVDGLYAGGDCEQAERGVCAAGAPKKELDVPVATADDDAVAPPVRHKAETEEADPDAPAEPKPAPAGVGVPPMTEDVPQDAPAPVERRPSCACFAD